MRAVVLTGHGGLDKLVFHENWPTPGPETDEVLIRVGASGLNNTDGNTRSGVLGGNMLLALQHNRKAAGLVVHGVIRDYGEAATQNFPIFTQDGRTTPDYDAQPEEGRCARVTLAAAVAVAALQPAMLAEC